ncbi:MAG: MOSC domain-containing protein [Anaerolineales bacterium]|nr:MAG: MOSC domain-containing protein [Anaerolineales bacterium]
MLYYANFTLERGILIPRVTHLHCKIGHRKEMDPRTSLRIVANKGIDGDASFGRSQRQILLVSGDVLLDFDLKPGDLRENIVVEGLALEALPPGTELRIGNSNLNITGPCEPCGRMDEIQDGLLDALRGRRGVLARAVSDGQISVGDHVEVILP